MENRYYKICKIIDNKKSRTGKMKITKWLQYDGTFKTNKIMADRFLHDAGLPLVHKLQKEYKKQFWVSFYMVYENHSINRYLENLSIAKAQGKNNGNK